MVILGCILGFFAGLSLVLTVWQWSVARHFQLHRGSGEILAAAPGVTVLKPLKGCDDQTARCLRSWFRQAYNGPRQLLFGVADPNDPVTHLVRQLLAKHPSVDAELVICRESVGPNAKVSSLTQLERLAKYELVVISDADVEAPPQLLSELAVAMRPADIGIVNCFYAVPNPLTAAMRWEAVAINADFWSQVLQARALKPMDFALGAVMATRLSLLKQIGGFGTLVHYLADDYQLGRRITSLGVRSEICPIVVTCLSGPATWKDIWMHQLRWARTIRVCRPGAYFLSILHNATWWSFLLLAVVCGTALSWWWVGPGVAGVVARILVAQDLQRRLTQCNVPGSACFLVVLKDLLQVVIWALAFLGNRVVWRGQVFHVQPGGELRSE